MNQKSILVTGITLAGLGVAIGAFGAHGLKEVLANTGRGDTFELAVRYQFYHAFAILLTGVLSYHKASPWFNRAAWMFTLGILFFSGSLYVLALSGQVWLGAVTPIGGLLFIGGWIAMLLAVVRK